MKVISKILLIVFLTTNTIKAEEVRVFDFTEKEISKLQVKKVRGADNKTLYTVGTNKDGNFLRTPLWAHE